MDRDGAVLRKLRSDRVDLDGVRTVGFRSTLCVGRTSRRVVVVDLEERFDLGLITVVLERLLRAERSVSMTPGRRTLRDGGVYFGTEMVVERRESLSSDRTVLVDFRRGVVSTGRLFRSESSLLNVLRGEAAVLDRSGSVDLLVPATLGFRTDRLDLVSVSGATKGTRGAVRDDLYPLSVGNGFRAVVRETARPLTGRAPRYTERGLLRSDLFAAVLRTSFVVPDRFATSGVVRRDFTSSLPRVAFTLRTWAPLPPMAAPEEGAAIDVPSSPRCGFCPKTGRAFRPVFGTSSNFAIVSGVTVSFTSFGLARLSMSGLFLRRRPPASTSVFGDRPPPSP